MQIGVPGTPSVVVGVDVVVFFSTDTDRFLYRATRTLTRARVRSQPLYLIFNVSVFHFMGKQIIGLPFWSS